MAVAIDVFSCAVGQALRCFTDVFIEIGVSDVGAPFSIHYHLFAGSEGQSLI
jgi:hypothetical protein